MIKCVEFDKLPYEVIREIAKKKLEKALANEKSMETKFDTQIEIHLPKIREIREDSNYVKMC